MRRSVHLVPVVLEGRAVLVEPVALVVEDRPPKALLPLALDNVDKRKHPGRPMRRRRNSNSSYNKCS